MIFDLEAMRPRKGGGLKLGVLVHVDSKNNMEISLFPDSQSAPVNDLRKFLPILLRSIFRNPYGQE